MRPAFSDKVLKFIDRLDRELQAKGLFVTWNFNDAASVFTCYLIYHMAGRPQTLSKVFQVGMIELAELSAADLGRSTAKDLIKDFEALLPTWLPDSTSQP